MTNENIIWVSPIQQASGEQTGSVDAPFGDVATAVGNAQPGQSVVLMDGMYTGDMTIQQSGTARLPITICARNPGGATVVGACWYFYDVSDFIVRDIVFRDAPHGAIAVLGACMRNALIRLSFVDCGSAPAASATVFFGGSGSRSNVVENCVFRRGALLMQTPRAVGNAVVAVMISEGDADGESDRNATLVVRRNTVDGYDFGVIAGTADSPTGGAYGHVIEYNTIQECGHDGIVTRCGDTTVRGNVFKGMRGCAVAVVAGTASTVEDNRAVGCGCGIRIDGTDHTVTNNCLVRMEREFLVLDHSPRENGRPKSVTLVQGNTMISPGAGSTPRTLPFIRVADDVGCVIRNNLFNGPGVPYHVDSPKGDAVVSSRVIAQKCLASANGVSGGGDGADGCVITGIVFESATEDRFANTGEYGAKGWVLNPDPFDPDAVSERDDAQPLEGPQDNEDLEIPGTDGPAGEPLSARSLFFGEPFTDGNEDDVASEDET